MAAGGRLNERSRYRLEAGSERCHNLSRLKDSNGPSDASKVCQRSHCPGVELSTVSEMSSVHIERQSQCGLVCCLEPSERLPFPPKFDVCGLRMKTCRIDEENWDWQGTEMKPLLDNESIGMNV